MRFYKYQGTGNDFILIDNRSAEFELPAETIKKLCDRRFGIGADGLMLLHAHPTLDFEMKYFNADGHAGSLCGNGSRCIVRFANDLGIQKNIYQFLASDGVHRAERINDQIRLEMNDVSRIEQRGSDFFLNTGSPHVVRFTDQLNTLDVYQIGKNIRYDPEYAPGGTNVNFIQRTSVPGRIQVRTYERGVEDETFSCGTGVTACALVLAHCDQLKQDTLIQTKGGELTVRYQTTDFMQFEHISLMGLAEKVFEGEI
jgi:diaminopimelate epimerase